MKNAFPILLKSGFFGFLFMAISIIPGSFSKVTGDELPDRITVATWNLEWFYDDFKQDNSTDLSKEKAAPTRADWDWKRRHVAEVIGKLKPTIMCLQEVENRNVIYKLLKDVEQDFGIKYRYAFIEGYDFATDQDVVIIYQSGLVEYSRREQSQEMPGTGNFYNLSKHLIGRFEWGSGGDRQSLLVFNCHLRAGAEAFELRQRQARLIHNWMSELVEKGDNVIIAGDLNTEDDFGLETPGGDVSIIRGLNNDRPGDDFYDSNEAIKEGHRSTHITGRQFDRIFYSPALARDEPNRKDLLFASAAVYPDMVIQGEVDANHYDNYYQIPADERDLSDHYPLMSEFLVK